MKSPSSRRSNTEPFASNRYTPPPSPSLTMTSPFAIRAMSPNFRVARQCAAATCHFSSHSRDVASRSWTDPCGQTALVRETPPLGRRRARPHGQSPTRRPEPHSAALSIHLRSPDSSANHWRCAILAALLAGSEIVLPQSPFALPLMPCRQ